VPEDEIAARLAKVVKPQRDVRGTLKAYRNGVAGSDQGAVWLF
jgi:dihydroxyacid dehydratase/phosphogluconate dehydratase